MSNIYEGFEASALRTIIADLEAVVANYEAEQARLKNQLEFLAADITRKFNDNKAAAQHLEAYIENESIEVEDGSDLEALCDLLGVELTKEVEVRIQYEFSAVITIPRNADASDYQGELCISNPSMDSNEATLGHVDLIDWSMDEI